MPANSSWRIHAAVRDHQQIAEPGVAADEFAHHGADHGQRDRDLQPAEDRRQRVGQPDLEERVAARRAPSSAARWIFSGSIAASPTAVLMTTGKNAIRKAISTFGSRPNPNQTSSSGATATFGMACEETSSGKIGARERRPQEDHQRERNADHDR